ncbi:proline racemase family protein [Haladaptatus cibarius]|uniref:proline racemase family protein n=1 Tax=Haladaptatus cibarius TaxID=453847 RepID=UPI000679CE3E|nr:proline racemase family protein [Haladaptatus cibarius]
MNATDPTWQPPEEWTEIETVDAHTGGEPLRVITNGLPPLEGTTVRAKRRYMEQELDEYRRALMWEPRGHADMYGAVVTEPNDDDADFGVLFLHNEGYSTMCGHGIIALAKIAADTNLLGITPNHDEIVIDTPAGRVTAVVYRHKGVVESVEFTNVPSFVYARDQTVHVPPWGTIRFDIAFGGAFYAFCDAEQFDVKLNADHFGEIVEIGQTIKEAIAKEVKVEHPESDDLGFLYGTILTGDPEDENADSRNVCVFANGEVDRCPTGTGVSARIALQSSAGSLSPDETFEVESIVGSKFVGSYTEATDYEGYSAIYPRVRGYAHITGQHEFFIDPADPFGKGFFLR